MARWAGFFNGVDPQSHEIGLGAKLTGRRIYEDQPGNGARMKGRKLPFVEECRQMARDAHARLFPDYAYIGWDIAISPDGPVMIEGNAKPSMAVAQRPFFRDMPAERFCALISHHLKGEAAQPRAERSGNSAAMVLSGPSA